MVRGVLAIGAMLLCATSSMAFAAEAESCKTIRLADGGWTDNVAQNALAANVLKTLGYDVEITQLAMPVILSALDSNQMDIWLDNWMPSQVNEVTPYLEKGTVENLGTNVTGAGYGVAVPKYVAESGVKSLADLPKFADKFQRQIYGIEPGNDGNRIIQSKIDAKETGLSDWTLVESSEQGMLSQAQKLIQNQEWVVLLGWTPHPVMSSMDLVYLTGFENDGFGEATIHTLARKGYAADCPNAGRFFSNVKFPLDVESRVMQAILDSEDADAAALRELKAAPDVVTPWLDGVTTFDGQDAAVAIKASLSN